MALSRGASILFALAALSGCGRLGYERVRDTDAGPSQDASRDVTTVCDGSACLDDATLFSHAGRSYALLRRERSASDAANACAVLGMTLARVDDAAEHDALWARSEPNVAWISGSDNAVEGEWRWSDGALFWRGNAMGSAVNGRYQNWGTGEPNNLVSGRDDEDCLALWPSHAGRWNDEPCARPYPALCEQR